MDPTGYWMIRETTIHKASWIPRDFKSETKYTYDAAAKQWVRIETGDRGNFTVATAPMPGGSKKIYTYVHPNEGARHRVVRTRSLHQDQRYQEDDDVVVHGNLRPRRQRERDLHEDVATSA